MQSIMKITWEIYTEGSLATFTNWHAIFATNWTSQRFKGDRDQENTADSFVSENGAALWQNNYT